MFLSPHAVRSSIGLALLCGAIVACSSDDPADDDTSPDPSSSSSSSSSSSGSSSNGASFDVTGTWKGTAVREAVSHELTVTFDNNGDSFGRSLAGKIEFPGKSIPALTFTNGTIDVSAGDVRIMLVEGADDEGYKWSLNGHLTSKRMDDGQFSSDNPALNPNEAVFLETKLVKQ